MFLDKLAADMPFKVDPIQVDDGSEFRAEFKDASSPAIQLFLLPPRSPKLKGAVEQCNSSWRWEFCAVNDPPTHLDHLKPPIDAFQHRYNTYHPQGRHGG